MQKLKLEREAALASIASLEAAAPDCIGLRERLLSAMARLNKADSRAISLLEDKFKAVEASKGSDEVKHAKLDKIELERRSYFSTKPIDLNHRGI